jgi:hypothetical protein
VLWLLPPQHGEIFETAKECQRRLQAHRHRSTGLTVRDILTGVAEAGFDNQLLKTNKALLEFADQIAQDDLLPTHDYVVH